MFKRVVVVVVVVQMMRNSQGREGEKANGACCETLEYNIVDHIGFK